MRRSKTVPRSFPHVNGRNVARLPRTILWFYSVDYAILPVDKTNVQTKLCEFPIKISIYVSDQECAERQREQTRREADAKKKWKNKNKNGTVKDGDNGLDEKTTTTKKKEKVNTNGVNVICADFQ